MKTIHTPPPYEAVGNMIRTERGSHPGVVPDGQRVAELNHHDANYQATGEFIVRACNSHDALVTALKGVVDSWSSQFERNGHSAPDWAKAARAALVIAQAA
ncbi:MAG TPA: hypothetical protein VIT92_11935 [Burkholderiaceae bacterium]